MQHREPETRPGQFRDAGLDQHLVEPRAFQGAETVVGRDLAAGDAPAPQRLGDGGRFLVDDLGEHERGFQGSGQRGHIAEAVRQGPARIDPRVQERAQPLVARAETRILVFGDERFGQTIPDPAAFEAGEIGAEPDLLPAAQGTQHLLQPEVLAGARNYTRAGFALPEGIGALQIVLGVVEDVPQLPHQPDLHPVAQPPHERQAEGRERERRVEHAGPATLGDGYREIGKNGSHRFATSSSIADYLVLTLSNVGWVKRSVTHQPVGKDPD